MPLRAPDFSWSRVVRMLLQSTLLVSTVLAALGAQTAAKEGAKVEFVARDFAGKSHAAAEAGAKATIWLFVSPDCPISNAYAPEIARLQADYAPRGVHLNFVYAEPDTDTAALVAHAQSYGFRSNLFRDDDARLARACGVTITPEVTVIDARGAVAYRGRIDDRFIAVGRERSVVTSQDLRDALDAVLAGRAVATPRTPAIGCAMTLTH